MLTLPFIDQSSRVRVTAAIGMVTLYQALCLFTAYGQWVTGAVTFADDNAPLVRLVPLKDALFDAAPNGGPLGPLSWSMMLLFGTIAYDLLAAGNERRFLRGMPWLGGSPQRRRLVVAHRVPGVKAVWPFSAYYITAPFPLWTSGLLRVLRGPRLLPVSAQTLHQDLISGL